MTDTIEGAVQKKAVLLFDEKIKQNGWESKVNKILDMHRMLCLLTGTLVEKSH